MTIRLVGLDKDMRPMTSPDYDEDIYWKQATEADNILSFEADTIEAVIEEAEDFLDADRESTTDYGDGEWHLYRMENAEGDCASAAEKAAWEKGELTLWDTVWTFKAYTQEVLESEITPPTPPTSKCPITGDGCNPEAGQINEKLLTALKNARNILAQALPLFAEESTDEQDSRDEVASVIDEADFAIAEAEGRTA